MLVVSLVDENETARAALGFEGNGGFCTVERWHLDA
jgi:hypothetical protein